MTHDTSGRGIDSRPAGGPVRVREFEGQGASVQDLFALLDQAGLPTADLGGAPGLLVTLGHPAVGGAVVERYGSSGLLRSVVVAPEHRGRGVGLKVVAAAQEAACEAGINTLYLLTETAETFFRRIGYEVVDRDLIPQEVRRSTEFATVCPASAVAMRIILEG